MYQHWLQLAKVMENYDWNILVLCRRQDEEMDLNYMYVQFEALSRISVRIQFALIS